MKASHWGEGVSTVRTSIQIPENLWKAAKFRAVEEKKNLQDVIADALRVYLRVAKKGGKKVEG